MAIHELTTNAAKFGSLSIIGGSVSVEWDVLEDGDERRLDFRWIERNGPPLEPPTHQGFGTRLLRQVLTMQTNAEVVMDFDRAGLQLRVVLPLR
jgi:two-component sensor histidine kinase